MSEPGTPVDEVETRESGARAVLSTLDASLESTLSDGHYQPCLGDHVEGSSPQNLLSTVDLSFSKPSRRVEAAKSSAAPHQHLANIVPYSSCVECVSPCPDSISRTKQR